MTPEFPCTCTGFQLGCNRRCVGCQANAAVIAAVMNERARCAAVARKVAKDLCPDPAEMGHRVGLFIALRIEEGI